MEIAELIAALRREGEALAEAAARTDLEAPILACLDWRLRDLLAHIGGVHRWATTHVAERRPRPMDDAEEVALFAQAPDDAALLDWFRDGHAVLGWDNDSFDTAGKLPEGLKRANKHQFITRLPRRL